MNNLPTTKGETREYVRASRLVVSKFSSVPHTSLCWFGGPAPPQRLVSDWSLPLASDRGVH